jgi:hypothetical protein
MKGPTPFRYCQVTCTSYVNLGFDVILSILPVHRKRCYNNPSLYLLGFKHLTPNDLYRRRAVRPLKIKITVKTLCKQSCAEGFNSDVKGLRKA